MARGDIVEVDSASARRRRETQSRTQRPMPSFDPGQLQAYQQRPPGKPLPSGAAAFAAQAPPGYSAEEGQRQMQCMVSRALAELAGEGESGAAARAKRRKAREEAARKLPLIVADDIKARLDPNQIKLIELVKEGQSVVLL